MILTLKLQEESKCYNRNFLGLEYFNLSGLMILKLLGKVTTDY